MIATLTPAYGRDYTSKRATLADFNANMDFVFNDVTSRYDNKPCNKSDLKSTGVKTVKIRYNKLMKLIVVNL